MHIASYMDTYSYMHTYQDQTEALNGTKCFSNRIISDCNNIPENVIATTSVYAFKASFDKHYS